MGSGFPGYLPEIRLIVRVLAKAEVFLQYSGASSARRLYCACTAKSMYLYSFLRFSGQKCGSLMHLPILWDVDAIVWSHSYMFQARLRLFASCILQIAEVHMIHQLLSVRAIHF